MCSFQEYVICSSFLSACFSKITTHPQRKRWVFLQILIQRSYARTSSSLVRDQIYFCRYAWIERLDLLKVFCLTFYHCKSPWNPPFGEYLMVFSKHQKSKSKCQVHSATPSFWPFLVQRSVCQMDFLPVATAARAGRFKCLDVGNAEERWLAPYLKTATPMGKYRNIIIIIIIIIIQSLR